MIAIVLTILVLELRVPESLGNQSLAATLEELRPTLVAWIISFLITGMYWVAHRDLFSRIMVVNRDVVWLNLLFLLTVSLIPFAASVLGRFDEDPIALRSYGAVMIVATVMRLLLYWYVVRHPELLWTHERLEKAGIGFAITAGPLVVYAMAMAVADYSTSLSVFLYLAVPILYFLLVTALRAIRSSRAEADGFS